MKKLLFLILIFSSINFYAQSRGVLGKWNTIDEVTGKALSVVEIYEYNNKIYGKIVEILNPKNRNNTCKDCPGEDFNKPVLGLIIIKGLVKDGSEYNDGKILDPKSGKLYKCYIELESPNKLKVRGYLGISLIGRTQYWERVK
ncbi:MAG: DUF2147 domain-containing protein [Flavobacteriaceae bacterium]|nr:DUF2147 domain-containing protein [Flavobacteriaceae bacterium]